MGRGSFVLDLGGGVVPVDDRKYLELGLPNGDGWQPYWAFWLGELLEVLALGLFLRYCGCESTFVVRVGRGF